MKLQGKELDHHIKKLLQEFEYVDPSISPISRKLIQEKLKLSSRGTLAVKHRAEMIEDARVRQYSRFNMSLTRKGKRKNKDEIISDLKVKISIFESERSELIEALAICLTRCEFNGVKVADVIDLSKYSD